MVSIEVESLLNAGFRPRNVERGEYTQRKLCVQLVCGWGVEWVAGDHVLCWPQSRVTDHEASQKVVETPKLEVPREDHKASSKSWNDAA